MHYLKRAFSPNLTSKILHCSEYFEPNHPPLKLIRELSSEKERSALRNYLQGALPEVQQLGLLGLVSSLLVYSDNFEEVIEESMETSGQGQSWLVKKIIVPYKVILKRYSETCNIFRLGGPLALERATFLRDLPYLISMLRQLSAVSSEVIKLGRYFAASPSQISRTICFFADSFMICLDRFYSFLRLSVQNYLHYLNQNKSELKDCKAVLKWFFEEILPPLNESMAQISYQKYFDFQSKGLAIKLLKIEELSSSIQSVVQEIRFEKEGESVSTLQKEIFPEDGTFNHQLFLQSFKTPSKPDNSLFQPSVVVCRKQSSAFTDSSES